MTRLWRRFWDLRIDSRIALISIIVMPAVLFLLVMDNWQEMQMSMSRESVITLMRSRIDAAKFTQAVQTARAEDSTDLSDVQLRLDILMSRRDVIVHMPDIELGSDVVQSDADLILADLQEIDRLMMDTGLAVEDRLDGVADIATGLDTRFAQVETYALSESNERITSNMARSEMLLWLSALLTLGTLAAASVMWWHRSRDTQLLREKNAALERERRLSDYNALHDELSGLPNRRYFDRMLRALAPAENRKGGIVLFHLDLDHFKEINDTLGHAAGDAVLATTGHRIAQLLEPGEFAARIGGDEFIVILPGGRDAETIGIQANALAAHLGRPIAFDGTECRVSASIGIAEHSHTAFDPEALMINADTALYRAKKEGRNRSVFFSAELQEKTSGIRALHDDLRRAVKAREFIPVYQPQYDARSRILAGAEALARWNHPSRGILAPSEFIKIAEEIGLVAAIDDMVFEQALADRAGAARDGLLLPRLSVNVSAARLNDFNLIERLEQLDIEPNTVAFELVETVFLDEADEILKSNVERIREMGIEIEIDDFGTGHASISGLMTLAPDRLKIDRLFVAGIEESVEKRMLLASVIAIGKSRNIEIVAEGVETEEQADILTQLGCNVLQGFALGRPMGFAALRRHLLPIPLVDYAAS